MTNKDPLIQYNRTPQPILLHSTSNFLYPPQAFNMRFSAISAVSFLGLILLAECNPMGIDTRETKNLPRVIETGSVLSRNVLYSRAAIPCPAKGKNSSVRRGAAPDGDYTLRSVSISSPSLVASSNNLGS